MKKTSTWIGLTMVVFCFLLWSPLAQGAKLVPNDPSPARYPELSAKWWQWQFSFKNDDNPSTATGEVDCLAGQTGNVYFLSGFFSLIDPLHFSAERSCTIPVGKALFFPILNLECSSLEPDPFFGETKEDRKACVEGLLGTESVIKVGIQMNSEDPIDFNQLIDLSPNREQYQVISPDFQFRVPAEDNILGISGTPATGAYFHGRSTSDGYWLFLPPLPEGNHTIRIFGEFGLDSPLGSVDSPPGFQTDVTYHLTITK
jgi:hypothetical protein